MKTKRERWHGARMVCARGSALRVTCNVTGMQLVLQRDPRHAHHVAYSLLILALVNHDHTGHGPRRACVFLFFSVH